jgi:hypothetical protein
MYCQFIILTFIVGMLWATWWWIMGVMPDSGVLPPLSHPVDPAKAGTSKMRNGSNIKRS